MKVKLINEIFFLLFLLPATTLVAIDVEMHALVAQNF